MTELSVVGKRIPKVDAPAKVLGQAQYFEDLKMPNMLHGKILRSPLPHAKILSIDTSRAGSLKGVKAIITGADIPKLQSGDLPLYGDQYLLALEKVRHMGEAVAAVAAMDEETAEEALRLIKVEYEPLSAVFDPAKAMEAGAPLIHEGQANNVAITLTRGYGDIEKGFREADYSREDSYTTQAINHAAIEPHGCISQWNSDNTLTVWGPTQFLFMKRRGLAKLVGLAEDRVRLIMTVVGGGFGGKGQIYAHHLASALLSRMTGRPVRFVLNREEVFISTRQRHPSHITVRTGVKKDGALVSQHIKFTADGGAYMSTGPLMLVITAYMSMLPYIIPNILYEGKRIYTNKPVSGPLMGHGMPQIRFAIESQIDVIAKELGIDPLDFRLKNAIYAGYNHPGRFIIRSFAFRETLEAVAGELNWRERKGKMPPGRGLGIACTGSVSGVKLMPFTGGSIVIQINSDGGINILSGAADIGQGTDTVICQIVAEELGVDFKDIKITAADTATSPFDQGTFGSGVTFRMGNAAIKAARDVKRKLLEVVSAKLETPPDKIEFREGKVFVRDRRERSIDFKEAIRIYRYAGKDIPLVGEGFYSAECDDYLTISKAGGNFSPAYTCMTQGAEVEVDKESGKIGVLKIATAHDCGLMINPSNVEAQIDGAIGKGMAQALWEELPHDQGSYLASTFGDYLLNTALDMPSDLHFTAVEKGDPLGPFGAKESGETNCVPTPPAIANALYEASGIQVKDLPLTPQRVKEALDKKNFPLPG